MTQSTKDNSTNVLALSTATKDHFSCPIIISELALQNILAYILAYISPHYVTSSLHLLINQRSVHRHACCSNGCGNRFTAGERQTRKRKRAGPKRLRGPAHLPLWLVVVPLVTVAMVSARAVIIIRNIEASTLSDGNDKFTKGWILRFWLLTLSMKLGLKPPSCWRRMSSCCLRMSSCLRISSGCLCIISSSRRRLSSSCLHTHKNMHSGHFNIVHSKSQCDGS